MDNNTTKDSNWLASLEMKPFLQEAWHASGFKTPTLIQERAVPLILEGKDVIAESPTGTGKTMAYLLPLLHKIDTDKKNAQAIVLTPSHELAMQIFQTVQQWTKDSDIRSASIIGGTNINRQVDNLKKHPHIIVATTGRLIELIKMKKIKMHEVKTIVVDEFDVLIAQEHVDNLKSIIKTTLKERQIAFFSATLSESTEEIGKELMKEPEIIQIKKDEYAPSKTEHMYILCEEREKIDILRKIIRSGDVKALAFINDGNKIPEIAEKLKYKALDVDVLTAESTKNERKEALKRFRMGKFPLLIATDVAARGLDIEGLTHVIHWDVPRYAKQYTHRSGRTGRMGAFGTVITIVTNREESFLKKIAKELNITVKKKKLYKGEITDAK
ncbi:MAG: DEAD/DEAH box helicase [Clostridiaceae bacterium]|nr:DEAD/DEAH box helicase [Clostridiaceae bacterium]